MNQLEKRLRATATGLDLLLIAGGLVLAGSLPVLMGGMEQLGVPPAAGLLFMLCVVSAGYIVALVGMVLCFRAPVSWVGIAGVASGFFSMLLSLVAAPLVIYGLAIEKKVVAGDATAFQTWYEMIYLLTFAGGLLFILFLRQLANYLGALRLEGWFLHAFILDCISFALIVLAYAFGDDAKGEVGGNNADVNIRGLLLLAFAVVCTLTYLLLFVLFLQLRRQLRKFRA